VLDALVTSLWLLIRYNGMDPIDFKINNFLAVEEILSILSNPMFITLSKSARHLPCPEPKQFSTHCHSVTAINLNYLPPMSWFSKLPLTIR
jgi:hypothetical protein